MTQTITAQSLTEQLVGLCDSVDDDGHTITYYKSSRFNGANVQVILDEGTLTVLNDEGQVTDTFFIKCELIPVDITPNP
jgi:hypothetical protein